MLMRALAAEQQALQAVQQQAAVGQGREGVVERQAFDLWAARFAVSHIGRFPVHEHRAIRFRPGPR